jgi:hypothetical protein
LILIDKPFVSEFLKKTIEENNLPVVMTDAARQFNLANGPHLLEEIQAVQNARIDTDLTIYTTSENAIDWIARNLAFTGLPEKIDLFKNKAKFRSLLKSVCADFFFRVIELGQLETLPVNRIPMPFIIKPNVGFFSMGVYKVTHADEWHRTIAAIRAEMERVKGLYPAEVLKTTTFIVEQCIEGEEFAVDAYFNAAGDPVILGIFKHVFASKTDVSDRIYITSKTIIEAHHEAFHGFLKTVGKLSGIKNFPVHVELRRDGHGRVLPVEINPMRFGGWCTTADMTAMAYGFNPYLAYFNQEQPDWSTILNNRDGLLYSIVVLDNSTGYAANEIAAFDYDRLLSTIDKPLELRKIDYTTYPVFGFLFTETRVDHYAELERLLNSDLREFTTRRPK